MNQSPLRMSLIGPGRVGLTLAQLAARTADVQVNAICSRTAGTADEAVSAIGGGNPSTQINPENTDLLLITVPDDAIASVATELAACHDNLDHLCVLHCSGSLTHRELNALAERGAATASLHPIKSFASAQDAVASFTGTYCTIEGSAAACLVAEQFVRAIGGVPVPINAQAKLSYHTGLVLVCNYLYTLIDIAQQQFAATGLQPEEVLAVLQPLLDDTVRNAVKSGPGVALTGPIARGDARLIDAQILALEDSDPTTAKLYRMLGLRTVDMALAADRIDPDTAIRLQRTLRG